MVARTSNVGGSVETVANMASVRLCPAGAVVAKPPPGVKNQVLRLLQLGEKRSLRGDSFADAYAAALREAIQNMAARNARTEQLVANVRAENVALAAKPAVLAAVRAPSPRSVTSLPKEEEERREAEGGIIASEERIWQSEEAAKPVYSKATKEGGVGQRELQKQRKKPRFPRAHCGNNGEGNFTNNSPMLMPEATPETTQFSV